MLSCEHEAGSFIYIIYFSIELKTGIYTTRSVLSAKGNWQVLPQQINRRRLLLL